MLHGGYCVQRELLGTWSHNWSKHFFQPSGARQRGSHILRRLQQQNVYSQGIVRASQVGIPSFLVIIERVRMDFRPNTAPKALGNRTLYHSRDVF